MQRKKHYLIAGNWKMNKTAAEATAFAKNLLKDSSNEKLVEVLLCAPFTAIPALSQVLAGSTIALGAQNMNPEISGAFTGEISAAMLKEFDVKYVILGHSERRTLFNESNDFINKKVKAAINGKLNPILCVGETLKERESGKTMEVIGTQIREGLQGLSKEEIGNVVIAYEPIWAIGTGKNATPEMAQEVHAAIRKIIENEFDIKANNMQILYGGSMKPENAEELLMQSDIDGGLIGGASLELNSFIQIIDKAKKIVQ
ncbi:MAG: triose-phosphate isomerase [Verrucomicrobia bacterium]|nr:MAG: triose-phosphate isomerase [Verrucomicrobiota bacterium]